MIVLRNPKVAEWWFVRLGYEEHVNTRTIEEVGDEEKEEEEEEEEPRPRIMISQEQSNGGGINERTRLLLPKDYGRSSRLAEMNDEAWSCG
ncbi:hypothetical protein TWF481_003531 [Arthrobotrys musiformis]|uniref:Uncharacterized protein n=1 Tax=Arthrobotrys musiformis TaxID=47236 RepID=A0AAV9VRL6_9PEZI